jgi:hypothetical protein
MGYNWSSIDEIIDFLPYLFVFCVCGNAVSSGRDLDVR